MLQWVVLVYKIPREPAAGRVYVWRKLKRLGALLLHDAVWLLPDTPWTREQFQWLASEIIEMNGEAQLWESRLALPGQEHGLVRQFVEQSQAASPASSTALPQASAPLVDQSATESPVEPIPSPSALGSGFLALAALAAVRIFRRLKLA